MFLSVCGAPRGWSSTLLSFILLMIILEFDNFLPKELMKLNTLFLMTMTEYTDTVLSMEKIERLMRHGVKGQKSHSKVGCVCTTDNRNSASFVPLLEGIKADRKSSYSNSSLEGSNSILTMVKREYDMSTPSFLYSLPCFREGW